jgi:hypothetical protein
MRTVARYAVFELSDLDAPMLATATGSGPFAAPALCPTGAQEGPEDRPQPPSAEGPGIMRNG